MTKAKIFIVEDERIVVLALRRVLDKLGYEVVGSEERGEVALESVGPAAPDLVLMDIRLGGELDGVATAELIRARHGLPVIYLTGYSDGETLGRAKVTEPFGYILKPFEERELQIAIETALYKHATEARLRRVERWLGTTLRSIADAVIATDEAGRVTFLNPVAENLTGWKGDEALGRPLGEVCRLIEPELHEDVSGILEEPTRLVTRAGLEIAVERRAAPLRDADGGGGIAGSVVVFRDVTERYRLEGQLRQLQKLESVGQLAAGLAHDFNNLLTVVQGHTDALRINLATVGSHPRDGARERTRSLDQISQAVEHAAKLTRQLLTFSRQQCVQLRPLDLNAVVENIRGMMAPLLGASVAVSFQPGADLPAVQADAGMIEQVLMNLAVNARDAMPEGGQLAIRTGVVDLDTAAALARAEREARPGRFVRLEVTDTGAGMDAATLRRACEPFFTTKPVGQGTGLGLSTIFGIVQQHGGWMELESQPGQGTVCRVFLPAELHSLPDAAGPLLPPVAIPLGASRGETILLVEDEDHLRELVGSLLTDAGYRVVPAASGVEALALWKEHGGRIDLVLTDMIMPEGINGRQLAERLRAWQPDLKIIHTSGYSLDLTDPEFARRLDFHFLEKPYRAAHLLAMVRERLDAPPAGGEPVLAVG